MIEELWIFHCGWMRVPEAALYGDGGYDLIHLPFLSAVAFHKDHGPILIDAPYGREGPANVGAIMGSLLRRGGLVFEEGWSMVPRIEQLGFRAADVKHILMTHLHYDHTGGMKTLCHANFHLSKAEWDFAISLPPRRARLKGYVPEDYRASYARMNLCDGPPLLEEENAGFDVFGDGSVEMFSLPGHSIGHVGYRFRMADGRCLFHVGDAAYGVDQIAGGRSLGLLPRTVGHCHEEACETLDRLRRYHRRHPSHELLPSHDGALGRRCVSGPTAISAQAIIV
ncbi:MAG: MBL fold metallo-hydrolase [Bradymonadaceae bacterium]